MGDKIWIPWPILATFPPAIPFLRKNAPDQVRFTERLIDN